MKPRLLLLAALLSMMIAPGTARAQAKHPIMQQPPRPLLVAIGGGYENVGEIFIKPVVERNRGGVVKILVLPVAYATNPTSISGEERSQNLADAEKRREQIYRQCLQAIPGGSCVVDLAQIFTRDDAEKAPIPLYFPDDLDGVFILGGDQAVAMDVMAGTLLEDALRVAYERGVVIGGTSAGAGVLANTMLAGYRPGFSEIDGFEFGAVDLWAAPERRGLSFGLTGAIIDQHFYQRGRFARLLNTVSDVNGPHVGLGIDAETGAQLEANTVRAAGQTSIAILDAVTFHAADSAQYLGARQTLSLRNMLVHLLAPGSFEYNLERRAHSLQAPFNRMQRSFAALGLPNGAGHLYLSGSLKDDLESSAALTAFVNDSGGAQAHILIVAAGYAARSAAQREADRYSAAMGVATQTRVLMQSDQPLVKIPSETTGILLVGQNPERIQAEKLDGVRRAWEAGLPLLADQAAVSVVGEYFAALGPTPEDETAAQPFTQGAWIQGGVKIRPGLGLLKVSIEPELIANNRWGRLFALAYEHPQNLALGLPAGVTLAIAPEAAQVWGDNALVILDLSQAGLALGTNQAFTVANGLIDVFAPGEIVRARTADQAVAPRRGATPVAPTPTPTMPLPPLPPTATADPALLLPAASAPANTPVATPTRIIPFLDDEAEIPPPTDIRLLRSMIVLGLIAVLVIFIGIWINRQRFISR